MAEQVTLAQFCPRCGAAAAGGRFCAACGGDLAVTGSPQADGGQATGGWSQPAVSAPARAPATSSLNVGLVVVLIGGGLVLLGSFLPWITATAAFVGTISRSGIDGGGDGLITAGIGLVIVVAGLLGFASPGAVSVARLGAVVAGIAAVALGILEINSVNARIASLDVQTATATVGMGLYAVILGGIVAFIGGLMAKRRA